jgi:hypothetical protein
MQLHVVEIDRIRIAPGKEIGPQAADYDEKHWKASHALS